MENDVKTVENTEEHVIDEQAVFSRIEAAMLANGTKRASITDALGMHVTSFSKWKSGKSSSYIKHIDKIAEIVGMPVEFLLHGGEESPDADEVFGSLEERGISSTELASRLGISPTNIYSWRSRKAIPSKHLNNIMAILNSSESLHTDVDKAGTWERLKANGINKVGLARQLGVSKATVYRWKDDESIPDKYIGRILKLLVDEPKQPEQTIDQDEPEPVIEQVEQIDPQDEQQQAEQPDLADSIDTSMDISDFITEMSIYIEGELDGLTQQQQESCLADLNMTIRLSLKQIKLVARASAALNL